MSKILRIDLSTKKVTTEKPDEKTLRTFIGGLGLGIKILYDEVPPGVDALDPENRLIFATGPLNGTMAPGSGTVCVISKSPLTGFAAAAQSNGFFAARLKHAGYDAMIVQGASDKPVYIWINNENVEIRDAEHLWGTTTFECEKKVKEELNQPHASVACIGPAGENLVRYAAVFNDEGHVASTGGLGAVMGSKKLKAIAVIGTNRVPVANEEKLKEATRRLIDANLQAFWGKLMHEGGTVAGLPLYADMGLLPYKNCEVHTYPPELIEAFAKFREQFKGRRKPCWACPMHHSRTIEINYGSVKGLEVEEPEAEDFCAWTLNIGNQDLNAAAYISHLNDALGMDAKESAFAVSLAIDSYEEGLIDKDFTDGLELKWGNVEAVVKLLEKTAKREGSIGSILAEGIRKASYLLGVPNKGVYFKGAGPHIYDFRSAIVGILDLSISDVGSLQGSTSSLEPDPELASVTTTVPIRGLVPIPISRVSKRHFIDSLVLCHFNVNLMTPPITFEPYVLDLIRAATGWEDYTIEEAFTVSERISTLARAFNLRHGLKPEDEWPSPKMLEPLKDGPLAGITLQPYFKGLLEAYYRVMGWDERTGKPLKSTLRRLGLDYVIKDLYEEGS